MAGLRLPAMDEMKFRRTWLGCDVGGREVVYQLGGTEVARLIDRLGGTLGCPTRGPSESRGAR
jgi:hypothetical protein